MPHKAADRIRNVALIGHRGSGKTSLHEALLFEAGAVNRLGTVGDGSTTSDYERDEQEREMSIGATVASFYYDDRKINLIDTPGEPSFVADAAAALHVADAAVVVVNAVMGVEVHTERLWERAQREGLSRLVFVNMLDRERADFFRALDSFKEAFGAHVVATEIPIGSEHDVRGVIDLIDMKAFIASGTGRGAADEQEIPEELRDQAQEYREKLMDEVAENSDELMERYLEGEEIDHDEIVRVLKQGVDRRQDLPGHLRGRDQEPGHQPAAGGAGRGPALAGDARSDRRPRRGGRGDRDRARRGRPPGRLRVQDRGRPLHGAHQPLPRLPRDAALGLARAQRLASARRSGSASSASRWARS